MHWLSGKTTMQVVDASRSVTTMYVFSPKPLFKYQTLALGASLILAQAIAALGANFHF